MVMRFCCGGMVGDHSYFYGRLEAGHLSFDHIGVGMLPISTQLAFGADILWHYRRLVVVTILSMGFYLSLADAVAIRAGIWTIDPVQTTGVFLETYPWRKLYSSS